MGGTSITMVTSAPITGSPGSTNLPRLTLNGVEAGGPPLQVQAGASLAVAVTGGALTVTDQVVLAQAPPGTLRLAWYLNGQPSPPASVPPSVAFLITAPAQAGLYESQFVAATGGVVAGPAVAVSGSLAPTGPDDPFFFDTDGVGSVRQITQWPRSAATFVWQKDFQPFGLETGGNPGTPGGLADEVGFGGKEIDPSGLNYFGARYYSSFSGRFTTVDPALDLEKALADPQQWNRYVYVRNNPLRYVDPDGRDLRTLEIETMAAIAGPAAGRIAIRNGVLDTSGLTAQDVASNEGAALLNQLATSASVYLYEESATGTSPRNLDNRPDWRFRNGKLSSNLPPAGVDDAIYVDPTVRYVDKQTGRKHVAGAAVAFHELAEAYGKVDKGLPYIGKNGEPGAHDDARQRELKLIRQRPGLTEYPAGGELRREVP